MVKTHRMLSNDKEINSHVCQFCFKQARYWSQVELPKGKMGGKVVWHCQYHRLSGREVAKVTK